MYSNKTLANDASVQNFFDTLDSDHILRDCLDLVALM